MRRTIVRYKKCLDSAESSLEDQNTEVTFQKRLCFVFIFFFCFASLVMVYCDCRVGKNIIFSMLFICFSYEVLYVPLTCSTVEVSDCSFCIFLASQKKENFNEVEILKDEITRLQLKQWYVFS